jgi:hypothetical protein
MVAMRSTEVRTLASRRAVPFEGASSAFDIPGLGPGEPSGRGGRACGPGLAPGSGRPRPNRKRYNMQEMNCRRPDARPDPPTAHQPSGDGTIS